MAGSLEELAKAFADEINDGQKLTREDGMAAMQTAAAVVCGSCNKCNIYSDSEKEDSYYLYYLLRAFEQKGMVEHSDMPRLFQEMCRKKNDYLGQLNRNLGKATMNLSWKNRFLESRDAVVVQFRELAMILEEFSHQMEEAVDITSTKADGIKRIFRRHHMVVENLLVLEYENKRREAYLTVKTTNGRCMTSKEAAGLIGQAMGGTEWDVAKDSKNIITRQFATVRFIEEGSYRMLYGVARASKRGEAVSGDNYTYGEHVPGQVLMSISDGMGSGQTASGESQKVIELTEQLLGTGFSCRSALKLVNTVLLLSGTEQHPATLDLCLVDLHTGVLEAMKLGASATYVMSENGVEILEAGDVPMGVLNTVEPLLLSRKLWDDDRIIMVSDGVLDALPGEEKELVLKEYLDSMPRKTPQDMAERILRFACSFSNAARDDMTVLAAGIWKRK
ncbi:MAG: SpoIIE family protein phosphatase [Clostridiaceae bacterium]|nr:SpoIIE family protein phosphatase [Clostridiaceae bacterium]